MTLTFAPATSTSTSSVPRALRKATRCFGRYPYGEGLPTIASEADLKKKLPVYFQTKLNPYKVALIQRARITEANWWRLSEHRNWQVARRPKIVSTYFGLAGSFALDRIGDLVVVQGYGWQLNESGECCPKRSQL